jgi:hypothetical protein
MTKTITMNKRFKMDKIGKVGMSTLALWMGLLQAQAAIPGGDVARKCQVLEKVQFIKPQTQTEKQPASMAVSQTNQDLRSQLRDRFSHLSSQQDIAREFKLLEQRADSNHMHLGVVYQGKGETFLGNYQGSLEAFRHDFDHLTTRDDLQVAVDELTERIHSLEVEGVEGLFLVGQESSQ